MELSAKQMTAIAELVAGMLAPSVQPEPIPVDPPAAVGAGPFAAGLEEAGQWLSWVAKFDSICVRNGNRFTRSAVYIAAAEMIEGAIDVGEPWIGNSERSWRSAAEAYRTRAAEVGGDHMTTEVEPFVEIPSGFGGHKYGVGEALMNRFGVAVRKMASAWKDAISDDDRGPEGEDHTVGECVRMTYVAIDAMIDARMVPGAGAFQDVRREVYAQYKDMGEGVFGPFHVPGGPVPWSWGGQR
jgi:hypothetical protein